MWVVGCADNPSPGTATAANAVAAYVGLDTEFVAAGDLNSSLTMAGPGEPASPAGFVEGVRSTSLVYDAGAEEYGVRIVFQRDVPTESRNLLEDKAGRLGVGPISWLNVADHWPNCSTEPDCELVGDSGDLP